MAGYGVALRRAPGRIDNSGHGQPMSPRGPERGVCSRPSPSASLPRFPAGLRSPSRVVAVQAVAESPDHPPERRRPTRGGGSGREGHRRAGQITVAPPDPVTSRCARRKLRAILVLREADSPFWLEDPDSSARRPLARDDRSQVCASWRLAPLPRLLGGSGPSLTCVTLWG